MGGRGRHRTSAHAGGRRADAPHSRSHYRKARGPRSQSTPALPPSRAPPWAVLSPPRLSSAPGPAASRRVLCTLWCASPRLSRLGRPAGMPMRVCTLMPHLARQSPGTLVLMSVYTHCTVALPGYSVHEYEFQCTMTLNARHAFWREQPCVRQGAATSLPRTQHTQRGACTKTGLLQSELQRCLRSQRG